MLNSSYLLPAGRGINGDATVFGVFIVCSAPLGASSHVLVLLDISFPSHPPSLSPSFFLLFLFFFSIPSYSQWASLCINFCYDQIHSQAQIPWNEILWSKGMKIFITLAEQNCHIAFLRGLTNYKTSELTNVTVTLPASSVIGLSVLS